MTTVLWLRRDLRRGDLPALVQAHQATADDVLPVFVVDPKLWRSGGPVRRAWMAASIHATRSAYDHCLSLLWGDPRQVIPDLARRTGATSVHVTRETTPAGMRRDREVGRALEKQGVAWLEAGTPYAVDPGLVTTRQGGGYQVFTAFNRAWRDHGWPAPAAEVSVTLRGGDDDSRALTALRETLEAPDLPDLPEAGEEAALTQWNRFCRNALHDYDTGRDLPGVDGTSFISPYLKVGAVHPRTLLASLARHRGSGPDKMRNELAWREFYADVLWRHPNSAWQDLRDSLSSMTYEDDGPLVDAWRQGRTGFPFVDAGMRQLLATGWMHNRVRMVTASFLTKDLHVWWPTGARWFLERLIDGDLASNNHGWQWVAGTGTDAAPYFRVFNPVTQGLRFDPDGDYVRRWIPELSHLPGSAAHEPWKHPAGHSQGYPHRIVDHGAERREALDRYTAAGDS